jgi:hypothetical protein
MTYSSLASSLGASAAAPESAEAAAGAAAAANASGLAKYSLIYHSSSKGNSISTCCAVEVQARGEGRKRSGWIDCSACLSVQSIASETKIGIFSVIFLFDHLVVAECGFRRCRKTEGLDHDKGDQHAQLTCLDSSNS